jgi:hypothetical protein
LIDWWSCKEPTTTKKKGRKGSFVVEDSDDEEVQMRETLRKALVMAAW